jgi:hypothetical protein
VQDVNATGPDIVATSFQTLVDRPTQQDLSPKNLEKT